jgi:hypothetical protein
MSDGEFVWEVTFYNGGVPVTDNPAPEAEGSVDQQIQQLLNSGWQVEDPDQWQNAHEDESPPRPKSVRGYH